MDGIGSLPLAVQVALGIVAGLTAFTSLGVVLVPAVMTRYETGGRVVQEVDRSRFIVLVGILVWLAILVGVGGDWRGHHLYFQLALAGIAGVSAWFMGALGLIILSGRLGRPTYATFIFSILLMTGAIYGGGIVVRTIRWLYGDVRWFFWLYN